MKTPCRRSRLSHRSDPTSGATSRTIAFCCADWSVSNGVLRVVHSSTERGCVRLSHNRPSPDPFCRKSVVVREGGGGSGAPVAPTTAVGDRRRAAPDTFERSGARISSETVGLVFACGRDVRCEPPRLLGVQSHPWDRRAARAVELATEGVEHEAHAPLVDLGEVLPVDDLAGGAHTVRQSCPLSDSDDLTARGGPPAPRPPGRRAAASTEERLYRSPYRRLEEERANRRASRNSRARPIGA